MNIHDATEIAYKNGYKAGTINAMVTIRNKLTKAKLSETSDDDTARFLWQLYYKLKETAEKS